MKILHTSDWHIGHNLYGYDRTDEFVSFFEQLTDIVKREQPDAMIVSGDVYHHSTPSASAQRMYTEAILKIHLAAPEMTIVITAGNHDSSSKLEIDSSLWICFNVHVIGSIDKKNDSVEIDKHIITVERDGNTMGYIVAMPYVYSMNYPVLTPETARNDRQRAFFQAVLDETIKRNHKEKPIVLSAHLAVTNSDITGHDEGIGGMDYVNLEEMGTGYDYLALGHIHCPQTLKKSNGRARYSGSPLPVSFDETYRHSVSIVELERGIEPNIRTIDIESTIPVVTLPQNPEPFDEALEKLRSYPDEKEAYIRLNVKVEKYLQADSTERCYQAVSQKRCRFCQIKVTREERKITGMESEVTINEMQRINPIDIAEIFYKEKYGDNMPETLSSLMKEAIASINEANSNE